MNILENNWFFTFINGHMYGKVSDHFLRRLKLQKENHTEKRIQLKRKVFQFKAGRKKMII